MCFPDSKDGAVAGGVAGAILTGGSSVGTVGSAVVGGVIGKALVRTADHAGSVTRSFQRRHVQEACTGALYVNCRRRAWKSVPGEDLVTHKHS